MEPTATIIGFGRLGKLLKNSLEQIGFEKIDVINKNEEIYQLNRWVFLCVPDAQIPKVVDGLIKLSAPLESNIFVHCSGVIGLEVFDHPKLSKSIVGCMHPLMAISESSKSFSGITFDVCGSDEFIKWVSPIIAKFDAELLVIDESQKAKLHASAVITSNYMVTLMAMAQELFTESEFGPAEVKKALLPLMQSALDNLSESDPKDALTGPISRGDVIAIKNHLGQLLHHRELKSAYKILAQNTIRLLGEHLSEKQKADLKKVLDEA